jgi:hypothetical protein
MREEGHVKVAVLTSGGDAPGMNVRCTGGGPDGLLDGLAGDEGGRRLQRTPGGAYLPGGSAPARRHYRQGRNFAWHPAFQGVLDPEGQERVVRRLEEAGAEGADGNRRGG